MGKTYSGGTLLVTGYKLQDPQPIVDYMVVELLSDLTNPTNLPNQFEGMITYVREDKNVYKKTDTVWVPLGTGIISQEVTEGDLDHVPSSDAVFRANEQVLLDAKTYTDGMVIGLLDDRGSWDASTGIYPNTGGSGPSGMVMKGDIWFISVDGTMGTTPVKRGDSVRAIADIPAQDETKWNTLDNADGYIAENTANKQNSLVIDGTGVKFPTVDAVNSGISLLNLSIAGFQQTGVTSFTLGITISPGNTLFNVGVVKGFIIDNTTNPDIPVKKAVHYTGGTNLVPIYLNSADITFLLIKPDNTLHQQTTYPTSAERRANVWIGGFSHPNRTTIAFTVPFPDVHNPTTYRDLFDPIGLIGEGNIPVPNGNNMNFNIGGGTLYLEGLGFVADPTNGTRKLVAGQTPAQFVNRTRVGGTGGFTTTVDGTSYDLGGVVTPIPGSGNQATIRYIMLSVTGDLVLLYGQHLYQNLNAAITAVGKESFVVFPNLIKLSKCLGVIVLTKDCTNLSNTTTAQILPADKFGNLLGSAAGISTGTLQTAYINSGIPQFTINDTNGAVIFKNGRALDTSSIIEGQNIAGVSTFQVLGDGTIFSTGDVGVIGNVIGGSFAVPGGLDSQFLKANGSIDSTIYQPLLTNPVTGTGTLNYIPKWNSTSGLTNSLIYDNGTNVGIGTTNPTTYTGFKNLSINGSSGAILEFKRNDFTIGYISQDDNSLDIYNAGNTPIKFIINGSEKVRIDGNGNVGIGTTTPNSKLEVAGALGGTIGAGGANFRMVNTDTGNYASIGAGIVGWDNAGMDFSVDGVRRMVIDGNGNVGIGTTSPFGDSTNRVLQVTGQDSGNLIVYNNFNNSRVELNSNASGGQVRVSSNHPLGFLTNNTERMRIDTNGNVGIGTTTPNAKLEVAGELRIDNGSFNSTINQAGIGRISTTFTDQSNTSFYGHTGSAADNLIMTLRGGGNVGIGTTTPQSKLDIQKTGLNYITIGNGTNHMYIGKDIASSGRAFFQSDDDLAFLTSGGIERIRVKSDSGNVGIGTDSPNQKLEVSGNIRTYNGATGFDILLNQRIQGLGWNTPIVLETSQAGGALNSDQLYLSPSGNVGIGTAGDNGYKLNVNGDGYFGGIRPVEIKGSAGGIVINANAGGWDMGTFFKGSGGTTRGGFGALGFVDTIDYYYIGNDYLNPSMVIKNAVTSTGYVGIGTDTPATKLEVYGDISTPEANRIGFNTFDTFTISGFDAANQGMSFPGYGTPLVLSGYSGINFATGGFAYMQLSDTGNLTVNGSTYTSSLEVDGYATSYGYIHNDYNDYDYVLTSNGDARSLNSLGTGVNFIPSLFGSMNVSSVVSDASTGYSVYTVVGSVVTVTLNVKVVATALNSSTRFILTLPMNSNLTNQVYLGSTVNATDIPSTAGRVTKYTTNQVFVEFMASASNTTNYVTAQFSYLIN